MKRFLLLSLIAIVLAGFTQQAVAINGLWLEKKDGSKIGYLFENTIGINCTADSLRISTYDGTATQVVMHAFDDIRKVYFDQLTTKIDDNVLSTLQQQVRLTADGISISGFAAATPVVVADLGGRIVMRRSTAADGSLRIGRSALSRGTYIIKVDKTTIKFNNK